MITTVTSDEVEPLDEEPALRELFVEHEVFQSFGRPNQLKRVAIVCETASEITLSAGSNSGIIAGPFECPAAVMQTIELNNDATGNLRNLLDILSNKTKAIQLLEGSEYAESASHGNALKINFKDHQNPSNSFTWNKNVLFAQGGLLKVISSLTDG
jgi:hypothetical protein